jgi:hypothetical protein
MTVVDSVRHPLFDRFELLLPGTNRDKWSDVFISSQLLNFLARHRGRATRVPKRHALILFRHFLRCAFAPLQHVFHFPVPRSRVRGPAREEEQLPLDARQLFFLFFENIFVRVVFFAARLPQLVNRRSSYPNQTVNLRHIASVDE